MENAQVHIGRMGKRVPAEGEVRFLTITDKQFGKIEVYVGKRREKPKTSPAQLEFF